MKKIGFMGVGVIGAPMVRNLLGRKFQGHAAGDSTIVLALRRLYENVRSVFLLQRSLTSKCPNNRLCKRLHFAAHSTKGERHGSVH